MIRLTAKILCVTFAPALSFDPHIKEITKSTFVTSLESFLSLADGVTLIYLCHLALIIVTFQPKGCVIVLIVQIVCNAAARILTKSRNWTT